MFFYERCEKFKIMSYYTSTKKFIGKSFLLCVINFGVYAITPPAPTIIPAVGTIEVAFSPNNGVTNVVVKAIAEAKKTILVEAYSFTSKDIAEALLNAKKRGVAIRMILDKSQVSAKYSSARFFANSGFNLKIDTKHAIFHDKVMIIDGSTVINGSFNFTKAAETKNAENLLVSRGNVKLANLYTQDFEYDWSIALSYPDYLAKKYASKRYYE